MYERVARYYSYRNDARDNPSRYVYRNRVNYRELHMVSILSKEFVWTPAAATNIVNTFRRHGWTPPSEQLEYVNKWKSFKDNNHAENSISTGQSTEIVRASTQDQR